MLRKQLQLYRMEGAPRDYKDSTLMIGNGVPASAASAFGGSIASPSASRQGSTMQLQRNGSSSGFDRDRDRDDAKQSAYGGGAAAGDREIFTRQPSSSSSSAAPPAFTRPASLFTKSNDAGEEPRFQPPASRDSPSSRLALGRAFGGAGSERLDLSLSNGGSLLQRSPSGRAHLLASSAEFGGGGSSSAAAAGERDDLVSDLNPHPMGGGMHRAGSLSSFDRRPSMERDREGGATALHLGATQEFSVNYGEP